MGDVKAEAAGPQTRRPAGQPSWLGAGLAVAAVGWGANQFAPLLFVYRQDLGLSPATAAATFGLYAVGLIPGLFIGGPLSDRYGRRVVMLISLVVSLLGTIALMMGGMSFGWLFAGRLISGLASGAAFSSGTAWIKELSAHDTVRGEKNPGPRRATIAMSIGFAGGPLVASILAQWAPDRGLLPYVPHLLLAIAAVPLVLRTPGPAPAPADGATRQREKMHPFDARRFRTVVVPLAPWVFGAAAISLVYLPAQFSAKLGGYALVLSGVLAACTALSGVFIQPVARRIDHETRPRLIAASLGIVAAGVLVSMGALATGLLWLLFASAIVLGAGYGACQVCGLLEVQRLATDRNLGFLTAVYQALTYVGFALPFLLSAFQVAVSPLILLLIVLLLVVATLAWTTFAALRQPLRDQG